MIKQLLLVFFLLMSVPTAFAEEIVMSVDQSEYYFLVGENAMIPLTIDNKYEHQIDGMLQHSIIQHITQGNTQISQSNTRSSSFPVDSGEQIISLDFGTSESPTTLSVELSYHYRDDDLVVSLEPFTIEFVADESQKNNQQNQMQSTTQQSPQQNNPNPSQSMQQRLDEMMQSPSMQSDPQQRLQNNQIPQDSSALKQQIYEQLEDENQLRKEFENTLATNEQFQEFHKELLEQGYDVTGGNLDPTTNSTGNFQVDYQNKQGKWAKLQGSMTDGTIDKIQSQTQQETEQMLEQLRSDPTFQQYDEQLRLDEFSELGMEFLHDSNQTTIEIKYQNQDKQTATIIGQFEDDIIVDVSIEQQSDDPIWIYWMGVAMVALATISYVLYRKLRSKKKTLPPSPPVTKQEPFDHVVAAEKLLKEGKQHFEEKNYKDAYGMVNQALRLFLSYELNFNKEMTNEEILESVPSEDYSISDIDKCFKIASLVEFAKYDPDKDDFQTIVSITDKIIHGNNKS
ncbi:MAG: hypothetical protein K5798_02970 [Nitrosopumilus sp.]|uniref:hypothetical protein n=1 Tax=Nitrosopumilus sp. TaxID=2024843 RepID=UPI00242B956F|nr:hypothetical protein [Nitrosopumilus sp.]MCV0366212.1 hypothetical protein [Nitrosopumilus sp.]